MPILQEKLGDPFHATQNMLLVPMAAETDRVPTEGFAGQVLSRFVLARIEFSRSPLMRGEIREVGGGSMWLPSYTLGLLGMHIEGSGGWKDSPLHLQEGLDMLEETKYPSFTLATAGTPGTGLSGTTGEANIAEIKRVMEGSAIDITVYRSEGVDDREPREEIDPLPEDALALNVPR